jgi:hypothetical protein
MNKHVLYILCILGCFQVPVYAQLAPPRTRSTIPQHRAAQKIDLAELVTTGGLTVINREAKILLDKQGKGIALTAKENDGVAWINGVTFSNGTIELDIKGKDVLQQSFVGVAFHGVEGKTLDAVYFRPFNFRAQDSVRRIHAVQYVSHPEYTWEVLRDKFNGVYENSITPAPPPNEWFHVKIIVRYPDVTVFVNNNPTPVLKVKQLSERKTGKIGLWAGNNSDGSFANLEISK